MKFHSYFLLMVVCVACQIAFASCVSENDYTNNTRDKNTREISSKDSFPSPYSDKIEKSIEEHSWFGTRHTGWCGTGADAGFKCFREILKDAPFEKLIPFLKHRAEYVRMAVHDILKEKQDLWRSKIKTAYDNGDSRIKLELLDYVEPVASIERRFGLLDEIIENPKLRVYRSDLDHINKTHFLKGKCLTNEIKPEDYPFDIVGFYTRILENRYEEDRCFAIVELAHFGSGAQRVVPALLELLKKDDVKVVDSYGMMGNAHTQKSYIAIALGKIGLKDENVISELRKLKSGNPEVSSFAAFALYKLDDNKQEQIEFLLNTLNDKNYSQYRPSIIGSIGMIGPDAKIAIPILEKLHTDEDDEIRGMADIALRYIEGKEAALERDLKNLKHENPEVRSDAIDDLSRNVDDPKVKNALYEVLKTDPSSEIVLSVCYIFEGDSVNSEKVKLLNTYIRLLTLNDNDSSCGHAVYQIHALGGSAKKALPLLMSFLGTKHDSDPDATIEAITAVGGDYNEVVTRLLKIIENEPEKKVQIIKRFEKLGSHAIDAIPVLYDEHLKTCVMKESLHVSEQYILESPAGDALTSILYSSIAKKAEVPPKYLLPILSCRNKILSDLAFKILRESKAHDTMILKELGRQLDTDDADIRKESIRRIGEMGEKALPLVPLLRKQPEYEVACSAIGSILVSLDKRKKYDEKLLLECLQSHYGVEQDDVDKVLELGVPEDKVIMKIAEIAVSDFNNSLSSPTDILSRFGEKAVIALPLIRKHYIFLPNGNLNIEGVHYVADIIASIGPKSRITIKEILDMMDCAQEQIIDPSIEAVLKKGGTWDQIALKLAENLTSDSETIRSTASHKFYELRDNCIGALRVLKNFDYSNTDKWKVRETVDQTIDLLLDSVNEKSSISLDEILVYMDLGSDSHKFAAANAVARITGNYDKSAIRLAQLSSSNNKETREYCIKVLGALGGNAKAALPILKKIKPVDEQHKKLLDSNIKLIETGKIRPIKEVAALHEWPSQPTRAEFFPIGVLGIRYVMYHNTQTMSYLQLVVDTNMPKGDDEKRLWDTSNWEFAYKDDSRFPDIVEIIQHKREDKLSWTITFSKELIPLKTVTLVIKLPNGKFCPEFQFLIPSQNTR